MAAIANLIVNVAADTADIKRNLADVDKKLDGFGRTIGKIGPMLAGAFSVQAVIGFAKEIGAFAGRMMDLSAQTGIGVVRLQALNYVAAGAGLSIENITDAVGQLARRVAGDDKSAVSALDKLGIGIDAIKRMQPDEAFIAIGTAVSKIENPMERTKVAMELFGRSGGRMLRIMTDDMGQVIEAAEKSGAVITKELIESADRFDDAWTQGILHVKAAMVNLLGVAAKVATATPGMGSFGAGKVGGGGASVAEERAQRDAKLTAELATSTAKAFDMATKAVKNFAPPAMRAVEITEKEIAALRKQGEQLLRNIDAREASRKAQIRWNEEITASNAGMAFMWARLNAMPPVIDNMHVSLEERLVPALESTASGLDHVTVAAEQAVPALIGSQGVSASVAIVTDKLEDFGAKSSTVLGKVGGLFDHLALTTGGAIGTIVRDIAQFVDTVRLAEHAGEQFSEGMAQWGDGNKVAAVGSMAAGAVEAYSAIDQATAQGGRGRRVASGAAAGWSTGNKIVPVVGGVVGAVVGAIAGIFRGQSSGEKVNDMRDSFIAAAGGLEELNSQAWKAGTTLDALLRAKRVEDFETAIINLTGKIGAFNDIQAAGQNAILAKQQLLQEATERYGFTLAELGPTMQRQKLAQAAELLIQDFQLLVESGINVDTVILRMSDQINAFIHDAMRTGTEVPESMRPMLETMVEQGTLTDLAGAKLTDLESLTFGKTLEEMFMGVLAKLEELIDRMADIPRDITTTHTVHTKYTTSGSPPGGSGGSGGGSGAPPPPDDDMPTKDPFALLPSWELEAAGISGYASGTGGRFLDFGRGTATVLHGKERVTTLAEGRLEAGAMVGMMREMKAIRRGLDRLPVQIQSAVAAAR